MNYIFHESKIPSLVARMEAHSAVIRGFAITWIPLRSIQATNLSKVIEETEHKQVVKKFLIPSPLAGEG